MKARIGRSRAILSMAAALGLFQSGWVEMSPAAGSAPYQPLTPSVGGMCENDQAPIACWRMEEGSDTVIYDGGIMPYNDGSLINKPTFFEPGIIGRWALDFASLASQYVTIPDSDDLDIPGPITISVWFRPVYPDPDPSPVEQVILQKFDGINGFELYFTTSYKIRFRINGREASRVLSSTVFERRKWAHILITYDRANINLYINGILQSTSPESNAIGANIEALTVGAALVSPKRYFNGQIDDIRIYKQALSYNEIQDLFTKPGSPQNLTINQSGQGIYLSWTQNSEPDLAGYNVYRSSTSPVPMTDPINLQGLITNPNFLDESPIEYSPNYYIVSAVDKFLVESPPSNIVSIIPTAVTAVNFSGSVSDNSALLTWETASEIGVTGFSVHRAAGINGVRAPRGTVPALFPGQVSHAEHVYSFTDPLQPGEAWYYWLQVEGTEEWLGPVGPLPAPYRVSLPMLAR